MRILLLMLLLTSLVQAQPVDPQKLQDLMREAREKHSSALLISQDGKLLCEESSDELIESMSMTKSVVALAVAYLVAEKKLSLDDPVWRYYPEWKQGKKRQITLRMLLNHSSGLQNLPSTAGEIYPSSNFVQLALCAELSSDPGTTFAYNNKAVNLLPGIVQKVSGQRLDHYLEEKLFRPLGITEFKWTLDGAGNPHGMAGCQMKPRDFLKVGEMALKEGPGLLSEFLKPSGPGQTGLLWWLVPSGSSSVSAAQVEAIQRAAPDQDLSQLIQMVGEYSSEEAYGGKLQKLLDPTQLGLLRTIVQGRNLPLRSRAIQAYCARGYLGNTLVVIPSQRLVALRMITAKSHLSAEDDFREFETRILNLTSRQQSVHNSLHHSVLSALSGVKLIPYQAPGGQHEQQQIPPFNRSPQAAALRARQNSFAARDSTF